MAMVARYSHLAPVHLLEAVERIKPPTPVSGVILACLLLVLSGCAYTGSKTAIVACQAFDTWTTLRGLDLGATETGMIGDKPGQILITKGVMTGVFVYMRANDIIDDKAATAVNIITCGVALHNLRVIEEQKRFNEQRTGGGQAIQAVRWISIGLRF